MEYSCKIKNNKKQPWKQSSVIIPYIADGEPREKSFWRTEKNKVYENA